MKDSRFMKQAVAYSTLGIELSVMVFLFAIGGYYLDKRVGVLPLFTLLGAFVGIGFGFYRIYLALSEEDRKSGEDKSEKR